MLKDVRVYKFTSKSGIYAIKNINTAKYYIGSAVNLKTRIATHKSRLKSGTHHSSKLQNSYNKHGLQSFIFELIELVPDTDNLVKIEQIWIDLYDSYKKGYNCNPTAGSNLGRICSDATKEKLRLVSKGRKFSEETKKKLSVSAKERWFTQEHRDNLSKANTGKVASEETRAKISAAKKGTKLSHEHKANMSAANKGRKVSEETKAKLSELFKGKPLSDETKAKMSLSHQNRSKETRLKMSAAQKGKVFTQEHKDNISKAGKERYAYQKQ